MKMEGGVHTFEIHDLDFAYSLTCIVFVQHLFAYPNT